MMFSLTVSFGKLHMGIDRDIDRCMDGGALCLSVFNDRSAVISLRRCSIALKRLCGSHCFLFLLTSYIYGKYMILLQLPPPGSRPHSSELPPHASQLHVDVLYSQHNNKILQNPLFNAKMSTSAPVTEIAILTLKPDTTIEDASTPAGQIFSQMLKTIRSQTGFQRQYWGRQLENANHLVLSVGE